MAHWYRYVDPGKARIIRVAALALLNPCSISTLGSVNLVLRNLL